MNYAKHLGYASTVWFALLVGDTLYELFQINSSESVHTLLGLKLTVLMTKHSLTTHFMLNWRVAIIYILFVSIWFIGYFFYNLKKSKK